MNQEKRKQITKLLEKWMPLFIIGCTFIGALLGSLLMYIFQGEFPYEVVTAGLLVAVIFIIIELIKQKRKKNRIPEADERVIRNMFHFFAYASHITLAILFISIAVFTLLGNETISIFYLWIFLFTYLWVVGIGALVVKRR